MVDRRNIVRQWKRAGGRVLATLVHAEGSSYRKPGAHLLIGDGTQYSGTISGGCLEAEVVRKALWMVRGGARVERYSTMFDDTAEIPFGLGCGGVVDLLLEPVDTPECHAFLSAMDASLAGAKLTVATWLPAKNNPLARAVINADGETVFASAELTAGKIATTSVTYKILSLSANNDSLYIEKLSPPLRLFVLGAGDDARPVVTLAALLGWNVTVADARPQLARPERFPDAARVLHASSAAELDLKSGDAAVLMTHSYEQDRALLTGLLPGHLEHPSAGDAGYLGLLGARHRSSLLISEAAALLGSSVAKCCEHIYAPVGLDLGGDGPHAVALAIVAEVHAWAQGKLDASRRLTADDVTQHLAEGEASRYFQPQCAVGASES